MRRSSHIAVKVKQESLEAAVQFYKSMIGVEETGRSECEVELKGSNFILYISTSEAPLVLQEFVATDPGELKARFEAAGCRTFDESEYGFHVSDPYGMSYHVWTAASSSPE